MQAPIFPFFLGDPERNHSLPTLKIGWNGCVCIYIYMYMYIHTSVSSISNIYIHTHIYIYIYLYLYLYLHLHLHLHLHLSIYLSIYLCTLYTSTYLTTWRFTIGFATLVCWNSTQIPSGWANHENSRHSMAMASAGETPSGAGAPVPWFSWKRRLGRARRADQDGGRSILFGENIPAARSAMSNMLCL